MSRRRASAARAAGPSAQQLISLSFGQIVVRSRGPQARKADRREELCSSGSNCSHCSAMCSSSRVRNEGCQTEMSRSSRAWSRCKSVVRRNSAVFLIRLTVAGNGKRGIHEGFPKTTQVLRVLVETDWDSRVDIRRCQRGCHGPECRSRHQVGIGPEQIVHPGTDRGRELALEASGVGHQLDRAAGAAGYGQSPHRRRRKDVRFAGADARQRREVILVRGKWNALLVFPVRS